MAAESSGTPEVKSIEENRRKRKRLTAVLDKLTSQVQVERGESKAGPSSTQQLLSTTGDDAGDVSPKIHVGATTAAAAATATHSWSSVSESCPSGDEGSISERSPFSPSGESVSSVSDVPTAGNLGGDTADKPTVEPREVQQSKLRLDIKKSSTTTKPDVFRFDTIARETYLRRSVSEEELSADKVVVVPPSDNQTPPIVEILQELGVRSPRASRLSPTQCSMQATDQGPSSSSVAGASTKETSSRTTPIVSVEEPEEVKAKVAKEERQSTTSIFELPRVLKVSKTKSLTVPQAKCHRSSVSILSPTFPVVCSCPSCSPLISITTTAAAKPTSVETRPPPLWLEAVAASEQFLAGGVPMSPVSPLTPSTPLSPVSHTFLDHYFHSKYLPDLYRRRSHSDGDLQQWTAAGAIESAEQRLLVTSALTTAVTVSAVVTSTLTADIAGTLTSTSSSVNRSGRPIPKPLFIPSLRKGGSLESDQSTPQDSPLDLSMKFSSVSRGSSPRRRRRNRRERRSSSISSESGPGTPFLTPSSEPSPLSKGTFELSMISPRLSPLARGDGGEREKSTGGLLSVPMMKGDVTSPTLKESLAVQYNMDVSPVVEEMPPGADVAYVCPFCGQMFSLHDRLAKHMASRHKTRLQSESSSKCYLCEVCKRSFARSDMLTRHMRLHTGLKPYTCQVCGQVFSRSDHLSTHQRTHTGEKPYRCPQCPYAACRRDMITRHMRTHARYDLPEGGAGGQEMMGDTSAAAAAAAAAKDLTMSATTTASAAVGVSTEEDITTESGSSGGAPATTTTLTTTKESSPKDHSNVTDE